jgi:hypothetical protein
LGSEFDAEQDIVAGATLQGFGDQHLIVTHAVEIAGVEQVDAGIEGCVDGGDAFVPVGIAIHAGHSHAAEAEAGDGGAGSGRVFAICILGSFRNSVAGMSPAALSTS